MKNNPVNIADKYFIDTLHEIQTEGDWDQDPRPKWADKSPAFSKFVTQKSFLYRIDKGELPLQSFRPTAIKGAFYDIQAIYQKQTNVLEEMHPSIHSWWTDFVTGNGVIGQRYGHTVARFDLVNNLLYTMEKSPFGRRHMIDLWQEEEFLEDPKSLNPCAFLTMYSITEKEDALLGKIRFVDMNLIQRSMDYLMTCSINPIQYTMLGMMICGHLTFKTGIKHTLRKFKHDVNNCHIYNRHLDHVPELLKREFSEEVPSIQLKENKDFYDYQFEDFEIVNFRSIQPLSKKLEIAV